MYAPPPFPSWRPDTALFVSPHLDDVAFSCGGALALLSSLGWRTVLLTTFTRSVPNPTGFALACQRDKGLPDDVDYMALRRAEDLECGRRLGASEVVHLPLPEAPHRGYGSAAELFAGVRPGDEVWREVCDSLRDAVVLHRPAALFAPLGLGGHVDHRQVIRAVLAVDPRPPCVYWYQDTPYVIRDSNAAPDPLVPQAMWEEPGELPSEVLARKLDGCAAYTTQVPFQFGSEAAMRKQLTALAIREAGGNGFAERLRGTHLECP